MSKGDTKIAITGVSIMVIKPLDISDIILAIFLLSIVYCSLKEMLWEEKETQFYLCLLISKFRFISKAHQICKQMTY
jgi:hypothetical protein